MVAPGSGWIVSMARAWGITPTSRAIMLQRDWPGGSSTMLKSQLT